MLFKPNDKFARVRFTKHASFYLCPLGFVDLLCAWESIKADRLIVVGGGGVGSEDLYSRAIVWSVYRVSCFLLGEKSEKHGGQDSFDGPK
jgi:hypothetical protein